MADPIRDPMQDWLYQHMTLTCDSTVDYSNSTLPNDPGARVTMSVLFVLCFAAVIAMPRRHESSELPTKADSEKAPRERWVLLDVVRIACVVGVVTEHSGGSMYSEHNHGFVTEWVLQWLFIVSGVGFTLSRASFVGVILRCVVVFSFGVGCNIIGDIVSQRNGGRWYDDPGNTIYQMWYVVALIALSLIAWPVRAILRSEDEPPPPGGGTGEFKLSELRLSELKIGTPATDRILVLILSGVAFITLWACYASGLAAPGRGPVHGVDPSDLDWKFLTQDALATSSTYMTTHILAFHTLIALHVYLRRTPESAGTLAWVLFALVYVPPILFPMRMAYGPHSVMLYLLGFYCSTHPFRGVAAFVRVVRAYAVFIFVFLILISMPTLSGRCDRYPPETIWERFRWYIVEAFLTLALLTRSIEASDPLELTRPLGWWALWAFCSHVMFARMVPVPYGAVTTYATAIPVLLVFLVALPMYRRRYGGDAAAQAEAAKSAAEPLAPGALKEPAYGTFGSGLFGAGGSSMNLAGTSDARSASSR